MRTPNAMPAVMSAASKHAEMLDIIKRTHGIFVGIKGLDISLISADPPGRTDTETFIAIPLEDPQCDLVHKHEWQHIFFKTDLRARAEFAKKYTDKILIGINPVMHTDWRPRIDVFIHSFCNAIDDLRVASLWHKIYPYSAAQIEERWQRILIESERFREDIVMYTMARGLGIGLNKVSHSRWAKWDDVISENALMVRGKGFPAVLIAARNILDQIISDVMRDLVPPPTQPLPNQQGQQGQQSKGLSRRIQVQAPPQPGEQKPVDQNVTSREKTNLISNLVNGAEKTAKDPRFADTNEAPKKPDPDRAGTVRIVEAALGVSTDEQVQFVLTASQKDMESVLSALRNQNVPFSNDDALLQGLEGKAYFQDILPDAVLEQELEEEDQRLVEVMRRTFMKLMDRKRRSLSESGTILNPEAFIDMMLGNNDGEIFEEDVISKGFSALILIDMSGSMREMWSVVGRAAKVLAKSLKFPFSKFEVWGFTSDHGNQRATIFRFQNPEKGYDGPGVIGAWRMTPLHLATEAAIRRAKQMPGAAQHLFILTDGVPTHVQTQRLETDKTDLLKQVGDSILGARHARVNVLGMVIGDFIKDADASRMFGPDKFWARTGKNNLFESMTTLVEKAFTSYLKGR
jgi:hypothetical protein